MISPTYKGAEIFSNYDHKQKLKYTREKEGIEFLFANYQNKPVAIIVHGIPEGWYVNFGGTWRFLGDHYYE